MKKLISLLAALAVVTTGTVAFAAEATEVDVTNKVNATNVIAAGEDGLYSVTASSTADQATILAIKGKTIKVGAIQYINQAPTTAGENGKTATFSFALNDALLTNETSAAITDDVYVLTGGDGNVTGAGYIDVTPEASTGATVSGTVGNVVTQDFIDGALTEEIALWDSMGMFEMLGTTAEDAKNEFIATTTTTARMYDKATWLETTAADYIRYLLKGATVPATDYVDEADKTSGVYEFTNVPDGEYVVALDRANALPTFIYVTVADGIVSGLENTVNMRLGDVVASDNVDIDDVTEYISSCYGDLGINIEYSGKNDFNLDCKGDLNDVIYIISNYDGIWNSMEDPYLDIMMPWMDVSAE